MELCDCGDLTCVMTARPIEENVVKMYFRQLISGLQFLHGHKLIHRDIKPKNILLMDNKKVLKIADFGFAKIVREQLIKERMCGSPLYMAPEIMNNDVYNDQSDLWSVGMILFEMLYGYHPFGDCNTLTELKMLVNTDNILVPPLDMDHIVVSELCKDLLKKLLQRQTNLRIGWEDFFNNMWTNVDEDDVNDDIDEEIDNRPKTKALNINIPKNIQNNTPESYNTPDSIIKIMHSNINIVENYYYTDNSPVVKINNHITSSCIFEMEFNDDYKVKKIVL
jgi:serine/threonine-protein kinase ULK2